MSSTFTLSDFHLLDVPGKSVVFHGGTYRFFEVDPEIARVLSRVEAGEGDSLGAGEIGAALQKLNAQVAEGSFDLKNNLLGDDEGIAGFYLFVSQDCNLSCAYCYGDGGDYGKTRSLMNQETADLFVDRFLTGERPRYMINFFGGEPLMNLPVMRRVIERAGERGRRLGFEVQFNLTTNGTLWSDAIRDLIGKHITNVTVSLDGPADINDSQRAARGGFSPYDRTRRTLAELRALKGNRVTIRTIVTKASCDRIAEIYDHNAALSSGGVGLTVVDLDPGHPLALSDNDNKTMVAQIAAANRDSLDSFAADGSPRFHDFTADLFQLLFFKKFRLRPCNACRTMVAIAADGEIYPCHRFVGMRDFLIGDLRRDEIFDANFAQIRARLHDANVRQVPSCSGCWARYMCGGCCPVIAHQRMGDIDRPTPHYCHLKQTVYHDLLSRFVPLMERAETRQALVANVTRLFTGDTPARC